MNVEGWSKDHVEQFLYHVINHLRDYKHSLSKKRTLTDEEVNALCDAEDIIDGLLGI